MGSADDAQSDPRIKLGFDVIDDQHTLLLNQIKNLDNSMKAGVNMKVFDTLLGVLLTNVFRHFEFEEKYFKQHPDFARYCLENYRMIRKLYTFIVDIRSNRKDGESVPSSFLESWFLEHIELFRRQLIAKDTVKLSLMTEPDQDEKFRPEFKERRRHKRVHHKDIVNGEIRVQYYNASQQMNGSATLVDMSKSGLMLMISNSINKIGDILIVACSIGANFKMKEKVRVRRADDKLYGVEFESPSAATIKFFTEICGAVHMRRKSRLP